MPKFWVSAMRPESFHPNPPIHHHPTCVKLDTLEMQRAPPSPSSPRAWPGVSSLSFFRCPVISETQYPRCPQRGVPPVLRARLLITAHTHHVRPLGVLFSQTHPNLHQILPAWKANHQISNYATFTTMLPRESLNQYLLVLERHGDQTGKMSFSSICPRNSQNSRSLNVA